MKSIENTVDINYATSLNHLNVSNIIKIIIQINISGYYYYYIPNPTCEQGRI